MSLDLSKLENAHAQGGKTIARCPACAEKGMDETGGHLIIQPDGRFGCVVHPGESGKPHRQRIAKLAGARGVPVIKVRVACASANGGKPLPIIPRSRAAESAPVPKPGPQPLSLRNEPPDLAPVVHALPYDHPRFREPENSEVVVGLYREDDGTAAPLLLWADTRADLFWDISLRHYVKPPAWYMRLACQPPIDPATGYPIIEGAVCPF